MKNIKKNSKNQTIRKNVEKSPFSKKSENFEKNFFCKKKNAILLVLPIEEISL